ncbi:MAG: hypothetical protein K6U74_11590, partial [Firmicutes bacterium]|nr:hypothetical protein [Bacillota bacterium]
IAPVEISNDGDIAITTTLDFRVYGNVVIERDYSCDCDNCKAPPPDFMNYPLRGTIKKTFTLMPHGVVFWDVQNDLLYAIEGYKGPTKGGGGCVTYEDHVMGGFLALPETTEEVPIGPLPGALDVGWPAVIGTTNKGYDPVYQPNYSAHLVVTPEDPQDYVHSPIDAWVSARGYVPPKVGVHLVQ